MELVAMASLLLAECGDENVKLRSDFAFSCSVEFRRQGGESLLVDDCILFFC